MRKLFTTLTVLSLLLSSCTEDSPLTPCPSSCGEIISDNVTNYSITIRNECSGNDKTFYLSSSDWATAYVGTDYCITNTQPW